MTANKGTNRAFFAALAFTLAFGLISCHGNNQNNEESTQGQDPADVNQAPVGDQAAASNQTAASSESAPEQAPAPAESQPEGSNSGDNSYQESSGTEVAEEAPQPPPALPEYSQPPCPDPNYIWTPGYWAWGPEGYYWVPGVWVAAPYEGALWTPGYWGYGDSRYYWHPGYWGPHVGFYGGINYGFGYIGVGFLGGFWSRNGFHYNRNVTNINTTTVTNVYNYTVVNNVINNNTRVSYNGGSGGINYQPSPAELAASRERHIAPLPAQVQVVRSAAANRAQFASVNHGRPQLVAMTAPVEVRRISPPAAAVNPGVRGATRPEAAARTPMEARPAAPAGRPAGPASRPEEPAARTAARPAERSSPPSRVEPRREGQPSQPAPERPATRAPERQPTRPAEHPAARPAEHPPEPEAHKVSPPHGAATAEKKQERRPDEHPPQ